MKGTLAALLSLGSLPLMALPVGNPADASLLEGGGFCLKSARFCDLLSVRFGFWNDNVFERHLEVERIPASDSVDESQLRTSAGFAALNFYDKIDLFVTLGATTFELETNALSFGGPPGSLLALSTRSQFSWSGGVRATLWECGPFYLGAEAQYFSTFPRISRISLAAQNIINPDDTLRLCYQEWQIGVGAAYKIHQAVPYIAIKWSTARVDMDFASVNLGGSNVTLFNLQDDLNFGYAVGFSLTVCTRWDFNIEWRFADESALFINMQIRV